MNLLALELVMGSDFPKSLSSVGILDQLIHCGRLLCAL